MKKRFFRVALILAPLGLACFLGNRMFVLPDIHPHAGDGRFEDISHRLGPFAVPGYSISMDEFDLGEPRDAEYHIRNLTDIGRQAWLFLAVRCSNDLGVPSYSFGHADATLHLELLDSRGATLVNEEGNLAEFRVMSTYGKDWVGLWHEPPTSFVPDDSKEYVVRLSYRPGQYTKGYKGYVYIECGGRK